MKISHLSTAAIVALASLCNTALAEDLVSIPSFAVTGNAAFTTDYMYRGVSQSSNNAAVQAGVSLNHKSGFYLSLWGSSIANAYGGAELDTFLGYSTKLPKLRDATVDVGIQRYNYPGINKGDNNGLSADFTEYYLSGKLDNSFVRGDSMKLGVAYANQYFNSSGKYWNTGVEYAAPVTNKFGVVGKVNYNKLHDDTSLGRMLGNPEPTKATKDHYFDYKAGVTFGAQGFNAELAYIGSNIKSEDCAGGLCEGRAVFSISKNF